MLMFLALALRQRELAVFILEDALSVWTNLGKPLLFVRSFVSGMTGTKRIVQTDNASSSIETANQGIVGCLCLHSEQWSYAIGGSMVTWKIN